MAEPGNFSKPKTQEKQKKLQSKRAAGGRSTCGSSCRHAGRGPRSLGGCSLHAVRPEEHGEKGLGKVPGACARMKGGVAVAAVPQGGHEEEEEEEEEDEEDEENEEDRKDEEDEEDEDGQKRTRRRGEGGGRRAMRRAGRSCGPSRGRAPRCPLLPPKWRASAGSDLAAYLRYLPGLPTLGTYQTSAGVAVPSLFRPENRCPSWGRKCSGPRGRRTSSTARRRGRPSAAPAPPDSVAQLADLSSQFYLSEQDVGSNRAKVRAVCPLCAHAPTGLPFPGDVNFGNASPVPSRPARDGSC